MSDIVWQDPPATVSVGRRGCVDRFVEALRANPGRWALYSADMSANIASQQQRKHPGTEWTTRTLPKPAPRHRAAIYARWVGEA